MLQNIKNVLSVAFGLLIIAVLVYATYNLAANGWDAYKSLGENTQTAWAVGVLSLAGTLFSLYYTKLREKQIQIEATLNVKKQQVYDEFISSTFRIIIRGDGTEEDWQPVREKFLSNSLLWSNPSVLQAYHQFRLAAQGTGDTNLHFARLILAFRKDLGLKNKGIDEKIILEIMYNKEILEEWGIDFTKK